ncbi:MAG: metallophosphoesterase [Defluviitaleaceae bacterium]|nr:metallophosphoesterase [Defluviitaleaceae bacterium]
MKKLFIVLFIFAVFAAGCAREPVTITLDEINFEDVDNSEEIEAEIAAEELSQEPHEIEALPDVPDFSGYPQFHLTILHTNDWHGVLHNVPAYATLVREIRAERENVLLLDGGDIYRRGPFEAFNGAVEIEIMNAMGYDALVFGNNEFPRTDDELPNISEHTILQLAEFPILLANATLDGEYVAGVEPYIIVTRNDIDIAIIGVTSPKPWDRGFDFTERYLFECPIEVVARYSENLRDYSDIRIALTHAGIPLDRQMRGVSAIISSDDHRILREPMVVYDNDRRIPLVQAGGERQHYLGQLDLYFAEIDDEWILFDFHGRLLSVADVEPCEEIFEIIQRFTGRLE